MKLINGFRDTFNLLAFRWQTISNRAFKIILMSVFIIGLFFLFMAANAGSFLMTLVTLDETYVNDTTKSLAVAYLDAFNTNELTIFVSGVLGATIAMIFITPFAGYSLGGIIPSRDLATVKANDNYKMSDSIIVQMLSSLSILQLFSLTLLSSLLTIEGGTGLGVVYGWFTWLFLIFFTAAFMWCIEYVNRRFGYKIKLALLLSLVVAIIIAIIIDPYHGTTLFGLSTVYVDVVKNIGTTYSILQVLLALLVIIFLAILSALLINFVGQKTLTYTEPIMFKKEKQGQISWFTMKEEVSALKMLFLLIFRYKVVWRPILITTIMASLFVLILGSEENLVLSSFIVVTPLVVVMSFGVNIFGVLGSSNIWLFSQPGWRREAFPRFIIVQAAIIGVSYIILFLPAFIIQKISLANIIQALPALLTITATFTLFALWKSLSRPMKYTPSTRGDSILPPVTLLAYMIQLAFVGGIFGGIVYTLTNPLLQWGLASIILFVSYLIFRKLNDKWLSKENTLNNIIKVTTTD